MPGTPGSSRSGRAPSRSPSGSPAGRGGNKSSPLSQSSHSSASPSPGLGRGRFTTPPPSVGWGFGAPRTPPPPQHRGGSPMANIFGLDGHNPPTQISGPNRGASSLSPSPRTGSSREQSASPSPQPGYGHAGAPGPWEFAPDIGLTRDARYYGNSYQPVRMTTRQRGRGLGYSFGRVPTSSPSSPTSSSSVSAPRTPPAQMSKRPRDGSTPPSGAGPSKEKRR
ncbi:hypothetical protein ASPVEDRAFT_28698 [Aspergillus versicolor CBS 583.65]|uniref:Uncharacterized protein n=1 Tax=Aspergillus versicolor CBS 583.65 TaxID=1036611 RepID=A0A1L9PKM0_ASPVE|nr:uncharacterized protein ASPVEDRAFT_28698 [Aspergillus versicolor CBS 583.65]OJJ02077.1 hypothetical protein ASPVEDRAFT_28698 [Aspergillus versicolor CBS 583.65]